MDFSSFCQERFLKNGEFKQHQLIVLYRYKVRTKHIVLYPRKSTTEQVKDYINFVLVQLYNLKQSVCQKE